MIKVGVVGATGLVGQKIITCLFEEGLTNDVELTLFASQKNNGKDIVVNSRVFKVVKLDERALDMNFDVVFFSAGEEISESYAKKFAKRGAFVIDNSNAFRRVKEIPLICPEINVETINESTKIIANPNCSTIQLVLVLHELLKHDIEKVVVCTYQSVSGAGKDALFDLENNTNNYIREGINGNVISRIGDVLDSGFCVEEDKIMFETSKILGRKIDVSATTIRVPVPYCHTESVYIKFSEAVNLELIQEELQRAGIKIDAEVSLPSQVAGTNDVHVCRLRKQAENELLMVIVADNLRRGAAYNAVLIFEFLIKNLIKKG